MREREGGRKRSNVHTIDRVGIDSSIPLGKGAAAASSSPAKNSKDKENRSPVDRHTDWHGTMTSSQPVVTNLHRIMDEQFAEQLGQKEVVREREREGGRAECTCTGTCFL